MGTRIDEIAVDLLTLLRESPDATSPVPKLGERLSTGRKSINAAIRVLTLWGYRFDFDASGVRFISAPDSIFPHEIAHYLRTASIGRKVISHLSVPSTNTVAFGAAEDGAPEGTIVIAEKQTAGKGRLGRKWYSAPRKGLWVSVILRPPLPPSELPGLSIVTATALAETIITKLRVDAKIKWPNDCMIDGFKVAGILTEMSAELDKVNFVVVGIGINVNHTTRDFPAAIRGLATSLRLETGERIARIPLLADFLLEFENMYFRFKKNGLKPLLPGIRKRSSLLGERVRLKKGSKTIVAKAIDIDSDGALLVRRRGETLRVTAGEVTVV